MNLFDILGPVMVGPSSSHTAGAVRIGLLARALLGQEPVRANLFLHGSFASTGEGHGTYQALIDIRPQGKESRWVRSGHAYSGQFTVTGRLTQEPERRKKADGSEVNADGSKFTFLFSVRKRRW